MDLIYNSTRLTLAKNGQMELSAFGSSRWTNPGPLLILHYYDRQHPRAQVVAAPSGDGYVFGTAGTPSLSAKGELQATRLDERSMRLVASFPNIHISVELVMRLNEETPGFTVSVNDDGIIEDNPQLYRILGIELLPGFGAARTGEDGYLTLPNWSGCQTFFDKSYPREVWETVYSSNDQWEYACNMGFFGITRAQGTLCGVIAEGDADAQLVCRVHWEKEQANGIHPYLVYRWQQQDERLAGPREVRYSFAPAAYEGGEGYVFCAKEYRRFLRRERGLLSWEQKAAVRPEVLDFRDRFFLKIFMAYKDPQADGKGPYHAATTFAQTRDILEECLNRGMTKLMAVLVGWGQDGHDGMPPTRFPVDERLGGEKGFRELIAWCREHDILLAVHDNYGAYFRCSPEFNTDDLIRHRTGEYWESIIWSGGQVHKSCPKVYIDKHTKRDVPAVRALGVHGHHHIDAVGSFMTCYSQDHPLKLRREYIDEIRRMFSYVCGEMGSVSTEMPFGPYFTVLDGFFVSYTDPSAWHRASPIARHFLDRSIPLLPIVVHGSIQCCEPVGKFKDQPLHWLDWGLVPQWEVADNVSDSFGIPAYSKATVDLLAETYRLYYDKDRRAQRLSGAWIEGRWECGEGRSRTLYSDGTEVLINRSDDPWNGVEAQSFRIQAQPCTPSV